MSTLYACRTTASGFLLAKFDEHFNVAAVYHLQDGKCDCPSRVGPCKHFLILGDFKRTSRIDSDWFYNADLTTWSQPLSAEGFPQDEPAPHIPNRAIRRQQARAMERQYGTKFPKRAEFDAAKRKAAHERQPQTEEPTQVYPEGEVVVMPSYSVAGTEPPPLAPTPPRGSEPSHTTRVVGTAQIIDDTGPVDWGKALEPQPEASLPVAHKPTTEQAAPPPPAGTPTFRRRI